MTAFANGLWTRLVENHDADQVALPSCPGRSRQRPLVIAATATAGAAALVAALVLSATTNTAPAYALTHNPDGSITITLHNLTTGIPQLNARLKEMGIDFTVIPVTPNCPTSTPGLDAGPGSLSETITLGTQNMEPAGVNGYLAAERLADGQIALGIGGRKAPLPTCFSPTLMKVRDASTPGS